MYALEKGLILPIKIFIACSLPKTAKEINSKYCIICRVVAVSGCGLIAYPPHALQMNICGHWKHTWNWFPFAVNLSSTGKPPCFISKVNIGKALTAKLTKSVLCEYMWGRQEGDQPPDEVLHLGIYYLRPRSCGLKPTRRHKNSLIIALLGIGILQQITRSQAVILEKP